MEARSGVGRPISISLAVAGIIAAFLFTLGTIFAQRSTADAAKRPSVFYLIPGLSGDAFYITMGQGARAAAAQLGVKLVYQGSPYAFSPSAQIPYLNAAIVQRPDAILIAPTDEKALIEPIRRAVREGIPVITVDTAISAPLAVTSVRSDNLRGGQLAADALAQAIHFKGSVATISVRRGISTTDRRGQGFVQELRRYRQIQYIGTRYANNSVVLAADATSTLLADHPRLAGIFAVNGPSGNGVIRALQTKHRSGQVQLVEFDADPIQVQALRQGVVRALIAQDPWTIGTMGVRLAYRWATGQRKGMKTLYYTGEVVLTRKNVGDPKLKRFLYSAG